APGRARSRVRSLSYARAGRSGRRARLDRAVEVRSLDVRVVRARRGVPQGTHVPDDLGAADVVQGGAPRLAPLPVLPGGAPRDDGRARRRGRAAAGDARAPRPRYPHSLGTRVRARTAAFKVC